MNFSFWFLYVKTFSFLSFFLFIASQDGIEDDAEMVWCPEEIQLDGLRQGENIIY